MKKKYYAVAIGRKPGIYTTWDETKKQVDGFPNAKYKGFSTKEDADKWIKEKQAEYLRKEAKDAEKEWHEKNVKPFNRSIYHKHNRLA